MKTLYCGNIHQDDVMSWCIENKKFNQKDQFELGYNWSIDKDIIYTNNDHFFNGVRVSIYDKKKTSNDVKIIFKTVNIDCSEYELIIKLTNTGRIEYYPDGCFDQFEKALIHLIGFDF